MFDHWSLQGDVLRADIEVGIPLLGRTGLGETPMLKLLGDFRARHLTSLSGFDTGEIFDSEGNRLYPPYYYLEVGFPEGQCMASIGENDRLSIVNTLVHDGGSIDEGVYFDGFTFFYPYEWPEEKKVPLADGEAALAIGVPFARGSNSMVRMVQGASWLKKAGPPEEVLANFPVGDGPQETYQRLMQVSGGDRTFGPPPEGYDPLTEGRLVSEYVPDADRDLNGLGLLYFANYPALLDVAERRVLRDHSRLPLGDDLLDLRSVASRRSGYMANIIPPDIIEIGIEAWIANPYRRGADDPEAEPVRIFCNYDMRRRSDGRRMLISTAEKLIHERTVGDCGLAQGLADLAAGEPLGVGGSPAGSSSG